MALLFPNAPTADTDHDVESILSAENYFEHTNPLEQEARQERRDWRNMLSPSQRSVQSQEDEEMSFEEATLHSPDHDVGSPSGYESLEDPYEGWSPASPRLAFPAGSKSASVDQEYEGVEGFFRFLQVCDDSKK